MVNTRKQWYQIKNAANSADSETETTPEVLIYGEIDSFFGVSAADLVRELAEIDAPEILVRINSPGGDAFDGVAILNALRGHDAKIVVQIDGLAASAASLIAMGGDEIVMNTNSQMMLHNAWAFAAGDADDLQRTANMLERQNANIANIYAARAGGDPADWREVMDEETWLDPDEAVDAGLADRVMQLEPKETAEAQRVAASFDLSKFRYQGRQTAPAPKIAARARTPQPSKAEAIHKKERPVATFKESLTELLGSNVAADDEALLKAVRDLADKPDGDKAEGDKPEAEPDKAPAAPAPPPVTETAPVAASAAVQNTVMLQKEQYETLMETAKQVNQIMADRASEARNSLVDAAIHDGRITPASRPDWLKALEFDPGGHNAKALASLAPGFVPVNAIGHNNPGVETSASSDAEEALKQRVEDRVFAKLGINPKKAGTN